MLSTPPPPARPRPIRVCVSLQHYSVIDQLAPSNALLILLLMFVPILFVISVSIVSTSALSSLLVQTTLSKTDTFGTGN